MSSATTTLVSAQWMASTGPALVWTRSGGGANIVVLTDDQLAVGVLPPAQLKTAQQRLENGEALIDVVGSKASYVHLSSVETITADVDGTKVSVVHSKRGGKRKTESLRFTDRDAQADFTVEVRSRLPQETEAFKTSTNRWSHAAKPLNLLVVLALATAGVHTLFAMELTDRHATRERLDAWAEGSGPVDDSFETRAAHRATHRATARTLAHHPAVLKVLLLAVIVIGIIGLILASIGYMASMTIFGGATLACLFWVITRLADPPQSILLAVPARC